MGHVELAVGLIEEVLLDHELDAPPAAGAQVRAMPRPNPLEPSRYGCHFEVCRS
jgi:hypothetical protein